MKPVTWMYIGAVLLFLMSACGLGLGGFLYLASLDPVQGQASWATMGMALACIGIIILGGGSCSSSWLSAKQNRRPPRT